MPHKRPSDDRKVFLVHSPGNHFTCYRRTSLKPPLHRPGLLLLENHGRAVVGAPKINPELGKPPVSHGPPHSHPSFFLKTTEFKIILTDTAQKSCESSPGTKTKIPGLDLTSKEKKVRDSILHVPEVLPEKPEEAWKRYQGRGFLKKLNKMKEEQDEKVWKEFLASSGSIFNVRLFVRSFVCLSRIGNTSSHLHYMMFQTIQTIYFL